MIRKKVTFGLLTAAVAVSLALTGCSDDNGGGGLPGWASGEGITNPGNPPSEIFPSAELAGIVGAVGISPLGWGALTNPPAMVMAFTGRTLAQANALAAHLPGGPNEVSGTGAIREAGYAPAAGANEPGWQVEFFYQAYGGKPAGVIILELRQ